MLALVGAVAAGLSYQQGVFWGFLLSQQHRYRPEEFSRAGDGDSLHGQATVAILIFQDLAMVPHDARDSDSCHSERERGRRGHPHAYQGDGCRRIDCDGRMVLVPLLLQHIVRSRSRELFLLSIIVLCLGIAWLTSLGGLSLALGAFIAGLVIAESEYSHQALAEVLPFRDSFNSLFFVSIGVLMDPRVLLDYPLLVLGLSIAIILGKFLAGTGAVLAAGSAPRAAVMAGVALAQVGEFSFILAQQGLEAGLLTEKLYQLFLAVSVLTMIITPFLMQWSPHLARRAEAVQRVHHWFQGRTAAHLSQAQGKQIRLKDHVIIVGYGLNGRNLARVLGETEIPYLALDLDGDIVRRESKHGIPIYYGDGANANVLRHMRSKMPRSWSLRFPILFLLDAPFRWPKDSTRIFAWSCGRGICASWKSFIS